MLTFLCALPVVASLFTACPAPAPAFVGYVEGEYVLVAPIETSQIASVKVRRGDRVLPGQKLAELERRDADILVAQTRAALAQAQSQLANLRLGKRRQEIAMIEASLASARAQGAEAARVKQRQATLLGQKIVSQANYDTAATNAELARARVAELEATLAAARLPARPDEIKAGEAAVAQAIATVENARWRLSKRTLVAQNPATVFDIIRHPGEVAGPQAPVLSVLPDGAVKLRFYLPEAQLSRIALGTALNISCRGCGPGLTATVSYIANEPEFTPPVIYSIDNRQKLVYLIEARPQAGGQPLKPGQIVDVGFAGAAQ